MILFIIISRQYTFSQVFKQGDNIISLGYGFPNLNGSIFNNYEDKTNFTMSPFGPIHFKYEHGISDKIGFGISINHASTSIKYLDNIYDYKFDYSSTKVNARINIHFSKSEKLDAYWGAGLGYGITKAEWTSNDPDLSNLNFNSPFPLGFETTIGTRYYFTENIAAYGEVGVAKSIVQLGLCVKFN